MHLSQKPRNILIRRGHPATRLLDERRIEAQAARDIETRRFSRRAQTQHIRRLERRFVESHGSVQHAAGGRPVHLHGHQVRGCQRKSTPFAERFEHGHAQRSALFGIGGAAELVEQHQRITGSPFEHGTDRQDVRRERAQALGQRLVIADIGQHFVEQRKLGFFRRRRQTGVSHQRQ